MGAYEPMERVGIDLLGPFPLTERDNRYILVAGDYYSKWKRPTPCLIRKLGRLLKYLLASFSVDLVCPECCILIRVRTLNPNYSRKYVGCWGCEKPEPLPITPVERFNRTLIGVLRAYVATDQTDWELRLPLVTMAYRSSVQETTCTQNMLGREINIPLTLMVESPPSTPAPQNIFVEKLQTNSSQDFDIVRAHVQKQQRRQKLNYDTKVHGAAFEERGNGNVGFFDPLCLTDEAPPWEPPGRDPGGLSPTELRELGTDNPLELDPDEPEVSSGGCPAPRAGGLRRRPPEWMRSGAHDLT
ncbi:uncharacterized protein LOC117316923 [Pecten maximus]|uniref:uncharacterized protein LOC117316923 n=1 Tax=Pecten maximus TaxID=6579 RepID=UPI001458A1F9|nr:uncharacterized protein LOC117316923 [Pecten maximus]